jgi:hypothetical protein
MKKFLRQRWLFLAMLMPTLGLAFWSYAGYREIRQSFTPLLTPFPTTTPLPPKPTVTTLPPTPAGPRSLYWNETERTLNSGDGKARFALQADNQWAPLYSSDLSSTLPEDYQTEREKDGDWRIVDKNHKVLYLWDSVEWIWVPTPEHIQSLPGFPDWLDLDGGDGVLEVDENSQWRIRFRRNVLYQLKYDPEGEWWYWTETEKGAFSRIAVVVEMISNLDPHIYDELNQFNEVGELKEPTFGYISSTGFELYAQYLGLVEQQLEKEDGTPLGSIILLAFNSQSNNKFWLLGSADALGVEIPLFIDPKSNPNVPRFTYQVGEFVQVGEVYEINIDTPGFISDPYEYFSESTSEMGEVDPSSIQNILNYYLYGHATPEFTRKLFLEEPVDLSSLSNLIWYQSLAPKSTSE